jgi:hypothetical protein
MTMPQSDTVTLDTVPSADTATLHSWQRLTLGCELTLHAAAREPVHAPSLQADFARLDATVGPSGRNFLANDGSWAAIPLIERSSQVTGSLPPRGCPTPALARMPSVQALLSCHDWHVLSVYVLRQPPHGVLPWHFDNQAVHLSECRLLLPIHAPPGAVTWIGHDAAAYPEGVLWTGDFSFPHQVDNPTQSQRIVLAIDARSDDAVRRLLPAALTEAPARRHDLARAAQSLMLRWRAGHTA